MTTTVTDKPIRRPWHRRRGDLGDHVADVVTRLQSRALRDVPDPEATGALARLRRAVGREPGSDYTLEAYLFVPAELLTYIPQDGPAGAEYAVHDAIALYALHQQSQRKAMFAHGVGLGTAVSILTDAVDGSDGVRRRFAALGTASSYPEAIHYLRSLATMLRGSEISMDYGLLAEDLLEIRKPSGSARVRAIWGREFYRARPRRETAGTTSTEATTSTTTSTTEENAS